MLIISKLIKEGSVQLIPFFTMKMRYLYFTVGDLACGIVLEATANLGQTHFLPTNSQHIEIDLNKQTQQIDKINEANRSKKANKKTQQIDKKKQTKTNTQSSSPSKEMLPFKNNWEGRSSLSSYHRVCVSIRSIQNSNRKVDFYLRYKYLIIFWFCCYILFFQI